MPCLAWLVAQHFATDTMSPAQVLQNQLPSSGPRMPLMPLLQKVFRLNFESYLKIKKKTS